MIRGKSLSQVFKEYSRSICVTDTCLEAKLAETGGLGLPSSSEAETVSVFDEVSEQEINV